MCATIAQPSILFLAHDTQPPHLLPLHRWTQQSYPHPHCIAATPSLTSQNDLQPPRCQHSQSHTSVANLKCSSKMHSGVEGISLKNLVGGKGIMKGNCDSCFCIRNVIKQGYFGNVPHIIPLSAHFCRDGLIHLSSKSALSHLHKSIKKNAA